MPELPEVETIRRGLAQHLLGKQIKKVTLHRQNLRFPFAEDFVESLTNRRITQIDRRGKYLLFSLEAGLILIVHLGMSGRLQLVDVSNRYVEKHEHVTIDINGKRRLRYCDPRRFGFMLLASTSEVAEHLLLRDLGPEPLGKEFNGSLLKQLLSKRKKPVHSVLMDQRIIAGLGTIYTAESLFAAHISPMSLAANLTPKQCEDLAGAIKEVLKQALIAGGSSLQDYRQADGKQGYFQHQFRVYGRAGETCTENGCEQEIERKNIGGRAAFYCPRCQRLL